VQGSSCAASGRQNRKRNLEECGAVHQMTECRVDTVAGVTGVPREGAPDSTATVAAATASTADLEAACSDSDDDVVVVNVTTEADRTALAKAEAVDLSSDLDEQAEESSVVDRDIDAGKNPLQAKTRGLAPLESGSATDYSMVPLLRDLIGQMARKKNFHDCALCSPQPLPPQPVACSVHPSRC
jgi:hypothetical protein